MSNTNYSGENTIKAVIKNVKNLFASKTHKHNISDVEDYDVDSSLSTTSTNPVENQAVTNWLAENVKNYQLVIDTISERVYLSDEPVSTTATSPEADATFIYYVEDDNGNRAYFGTDWDAIKNIQSASTSLQGIVQLTDSTSSTSTTTAATPSSVKSAYDLANTAKSKADSLESTIPTKTSELTNDSNFLTSVPTEYVTDSELEAKGFATESYVTTTIQNYIDESILGGEW